MDSLFWDNKGGELAALQAIGRSVCLASTMMSDCNAETLMRRSSVGLCEADIREILHMLRAACRRLLLGGRGGPIHTATPEGGL